MKNDYIAKELIETLNKTEKKLEMVRGERRQTNMKVYKVKVIFTDDKEKVEIVSAENELDAMDQVVEKYKTNKDEIIADIKIF